MKKHLLLLLSFFTLTGAFGQLNPVKNLHYSSTYQYLNFNCPQFNCFSLTWSEPDNSTDTLNGYNVYKNDTLYARVSTPNTSLGCSGCCPSSICSFNGTWFTHLPYWITVRAVYNSDSIRSVATDSILIQSFAIGINETISERYFTISPNPFLLQTTLHTDKVLNNGSLTVYDIFGKTVKQVDKLSGQTIILYRDNLPSGLYLLCLTEENQVLSVAKIVIVDN